MNLVEYIHHHVSRGECGCGLCCDRGEKPEPEGHTVDMFFFKVAATNDPTSEDLQRLIRAHAGDFCEVDLFDGKEHPYIELGGWIGDQGLALMLMGLGEIVGLWSVMQPNLLPGLPDAMKQQMAGAGMVGIVPAKAVVPANAR